jgi:zinc protease
VTLHRNHLSAFAALALALTGEGCGAATTPAPSAPSPADTAATSGQESGSPAARIAPPTAGPARDVHLPAVVRTTMANGLELDVVHTDGLPIVYVRLVVRSGMASDPAGLPGLSHVALEMLSEGTRRQNSAQLAEAIEFLGADLTTSDAQASHTISFRVVAEHFDEVMQILADMVTTPRFDEQELRRLKQRERDRLRIQYGDAAMLARREFYRAAYGDHPYAHLDATADAIDQMRRQDLVTWHRDHYVPNNAFLVVAGNVTAEQVQHAAQSVFGRWRRRDVPSVTLPEIAPRTAREVIVVHRAGSAQSVVSIGNLSLQRGSDDWVPLAVANQVLGGSAASRLFMDLRERRSLTYGAYSGVDELPIAAPFRARASVGRDPRQPDLDRTPQAMDGFMEHLQRIVTEQAPEDEVHAAQRFLSDSFPLRVDTAGQIAMLVADLRLFGLPDDYWDTFRSQIRSVTPAQALAAAQRNIRPDTALVVVVGDAEAVAQPLRRWGPVQVVDDQGRELARYPQDTQAVSPTGSSAP